MTIVELIGFLFAMALLLFTAVRRILEERRRLANPERYAKEMRERQREQEEAYREMLRSLGIEGEPPPPPPRIVPPGNAPPEGPSSQKSHPITHETHRRVGRDFAFHSSIEDRRSTSTIAQRRLETDVGKRLGKHYRPGLVTEELRGGETEYVKRRRRAKINRFLQTLPSKQSLLISRELFGPPRALQPWSGEPGNDY